MHPLTSLRSWLGRPTRRPPDRLHCESLEDRSVPAAGLTAFEMVDKSLPAVPSLDTLPVSAGEVLAQTTSVNPLGDLANVVAAMGLGAVVDPAASRVLTLGDGLSLLQVALRPGAVVSNVIQTLGGSGLYSSVTPNYVYPISRTTTGADLRERAAADPQFGQQFFHPIIRTPQAWDKTTGSPVVVTAILDDGLDISHPDLAANVWVNVREIAGNGQDDDGNGLVDDVHGYDFVNDSGNVFPDDPNLDTHGTQVAGLIAARIDNGIGGAGVAGTSRILPLKVIGGGPTTSLTIARAVTYAVRSGARIINCSLNVDPFVGDPTFRAALSFAYNSGVLWINSVGNGNVQGPPREAFEEMILVGATDRNDVKTAYSSYGGGVDLMAPGGDGGGGLLTTVPGGGQTRAIGSSMAAALASGTAALIWSANPGYTRDQVASALLANADDIRAKNPGLEDMIGAGRLDAEGAVNGPGVTPLGPLNGLPAEGERIDSLPAGGFSIRLTAPLAPATLVPANFELRSAGADERFGTADDVLVPLALTNAASYRIGTNRLDLAVTHSLMPGLYRFTARSGGLTDPFGIPVDGDRDGRSGGNLVRTFRVGYQIAGQVFEDTQNTGFPSATDPGLGGQTVYADLNGNGVLDQSTFPAQPPPNVLTDNGIGVTVAIPVSGVPRPIGGVRVSVLVQHPRPSDLVFTLTAPDGTTVPLLRNRAVPGDPGRPLHLFEFSDTADGRSSETADLTAHRLRPDSPLSRFVGRFANGTWRLTVTDTTPGDDGEVRSATLTISDEPSAVTDGRGGFTLDGLPTGPVKVNVATGTDFTRSASAPAVSVVVSDDGRPVSANLGLVRPSGIYGRVLADDGGRTFSPNDTPIGGATVFLDLDGNGRPDPSDPTTTTDANGNYAFGPLLPGSYRVVVRPPGGFGLVPGLSDSLTAVVGQDAAVSTGNDFLLARTSGRATATVTPVSPTLRNEGIDAIGVGLSEPLPPLTTANFVLSRDGVILSLDGATVFGGSGGVTLSGLRALTSFDGEYTLTVFAPAPVGQLARQPLPVSVTFTVDGTPPTAGLAVEGLPVDAVRLFTSEPVSGLSAASLVLTRDGARMPLRDVRVDQIGPTEFRVSGLSGVASARGLYTLTLRAANTTVIDAAGNPLAANASVNFRVGPEPMPPVGRRTVIGAGAGGPATVAVFDTGTGRLMRSFQPFEQGFTGGVRVAAMDLNGDGVDDIIAAAGPGGGPRVMAFDGVTGETLFDLMAFEPTFTGGVFVAAGDLGGRPVIVLTPDLGGGPRARVIDPTGLTLADFFAIADPAFRGGARPAVGDVTGDGKGDLIVSAGFGGGPRIAVYDGASVLAGAPVQPFNDFFAFESSLRNGAFVAAGDVDGDGFADLILGGGPGGGPRVRVLSGKGLMTGTERPVADFFAADANDRGGVRVAVKDADGDGLADIVAGDGNGSGGSARVFFGRDLLLSPDLPLIGQSLSAFGGFGDGIFVG